MSTTMVRVLWLIVLTVLSSVRSELSPEQQCPAPTTSSIKFSFESHRNETGHWISQFDFEKEGERKTQSNGKRTPPYSVDVEQNSVACDGIDSTLRVKITVTTAPHKAALPGYELFPGVGYYKFHANISTWQAAYDACAREKTHLAMTNSERETNVFQTLFARHPNIVGAEDEVHNNHAWLGFCEIGTHGKYFTLSGESINQGEFYRWSPGEPNNAGLFDCLLVNRNTGGFADAPRNWIAPFICEQEL